MTTYCYDCGVYDVELHKTPLQSKRFTVKGKVYEASENERIVVISCADCGTFLSAYVEQDTMKRSALYTISRNEEYSVETVTTDAYEAGITKHFICGLCVHVWLAYQVGEHVHVEEFTAAYRGKLSAWKLCSAENMAQQYIKRQQKAEVAV